MPQSTDELRALMCRWFGDMDETGPENFLKSHGYIFGISGFWRLPTPAHTMSEDEYLCIRYLVEEWDYSPTPLNPAPLHPEMQAEKDRDNAPTQR